MFEAIYKLPANYEGGKLIAYKTLCRIGLYSSLNKNIASDFEEINDEFMDLFYLTVHHGLHSDDKVCFCSGYLFQLIR